MRKRDTLITCAVIFIILLLCGMSVASQLYVPNEAYARWFVSKYSHLMPDLLASANDHTEPNDAYYPKTRYLQSVMYFGRDNVVTFSFKPRHTEGSTMLYYCPDGAVPSWLANRLPEGQKLASMDDLPESGLHLKGLINNTGYLDCVRIEEDWYFVDAYLPT